MFILTDTRWYHSFVSCLSIATIKLFHASFFDKDGMISCQNDWRFLQIWAILYGSYYMNHIVWAFNSTWQKLFNLSYGARITAITISISNDGTIFSWNANTSVMRIITVVNSLVAWNTVACFQITDIRTSILTFPGRIRLLVGCTPACYFRSRSVLSRALWLTTRRAHQFFIFWTNWWVDAFLLQNTLSSTAVTCVALGTFTSWLTHFRAHRILAMAFGIGCSIATVTLSTFVATIVPFLVGTTSWLTRGGSQRNQTKKKLKINCWFLCGHPIKLIIASSTIFEKLWKYKFKRWQITFIMTLDLELKYFWSMKSMRMHWLLFSFIWTVVLMPKILLIHTNSRYFLQALPNFLDFVEELEPLKWPISYTIEFRSIYCIWCIILYIAHIRWSMN